MTERLIDAEAGTVLVPRLTVARSPWALAIGLMFRRSFSPGEGLWLQPCNQIHTFFVRFPIDAVFLAKDGRVLAVKETLRPWRIFRWVRRARATLELPAGGAARAGIVIGQRLKRTSALADTTTG